MELTTRQWNLYNYLKENTDIYLTKEQIVANVDGYIYKDWQNEHNQNVIDVPYLTLLSNLKYIEAL